MDKKFNLYWNGQRLSGGSPHTEEHVVADRFDDTLTDGDVRAVEQLVVGQKHVDIDGDVWERIA